MGGQETSSKIMVKIPTFASELVMQNTHGLANKQDNNGKITLLK